MKKDVRHLEPYPGEPGWFRGFVIVNTDTKEPYNIYPGLVEAHQEAKRLGANFRSYGGGYCPETDEYKYFKGILED
jgi:hypothetical protein